MKASREHQYIDITEPVASEMVHWPGDPLPGLDLSKVEPGAYDLLCLPLKVLHGSPARAVLYPSGTLR